MANKSISQLDSASTLQGTDLIEIASDQGSSTYASKKTTLQDVKNFVNGYSTTEHVIGTWVDDSLLYEKTYIYEWSDMDDPNVVSSTSINCKIFTDLSANIDVIWIENAYLTYTGTGNISILSSPLNYSTSDKYTRANIQKRSDFNSGKPYVYFECTYPSDILGSGNQANWKWVVTIRYTKPSV